MADLTDPRGRCDAGRAHALQAKAVGNSWMREADYLKPVAPAIYNESMSLACQFGKCELCPEGSLIDDPGDGCSCVCHIPDDGPSPGDMDWMTAPDDEADQ